MTTPPYTGQKPSQHIDPHHAAGLDGPGTIPTPTPIVSHRNEDFTLADIQYLSNTFGITEIERAEADIQTRIWIDKRPGTETPTHHLLELEEKHMSIHRGDFIRGAYQLPDGTERVIWQHRVFDDSEPTTLEPATALIEAQSAQWETIPSLKTSSQQLQNHD